MGSHQSANKRQVITNRLKKAVYGFTTEYETQKMVLIHSFKFAMMLRVLQGLILAYSVVYLICIDKGYQKKDSTVISSVTLKVKGIGYTLTPENETSVVDGADYIVPPSENNAIFIMTNFIETDQNRGKCSESVLVKEAICQKDFDCQKRTYTPSANGRWTGRCLLPLSVTHNNVTSNATIKTVGLCEMSAWCPPEDDRSSQKLVHDVLNFTVFIKNFVEFPEFGTVRTNLDGNLKQCLYHSVYNKDCPIFRLKDILNTAEPDETERNLMLRLGGVIRVKLDWDCDFDRSPKLCKPVYSFGRLDSPFRSSGPVAFSIGYNFRYAWYWIQNERRFRTLTKAFGLRLIIVVSGKGGKFDLITLTLNIGSLVGIFGLATYFCDIILLHVSKRSRVYRDCVFQQVHVKTRATSVIEDPQRPIQSLINRLAPKKHSLDRSSLQSLPTPQTTPKSFISEATLRPLVVINPNKSSSSNPNITLNNASTEIQ